MKNRRKTRLANAPLQLRHGIAVAAIALLAVLVHDAVVRIALGNSLDGKGAERLLVSTLCTLVFVLPAAAYLGVRALAGYTGPLRRIQDHLRGLGRGEQRPPLSVRDGDPLRDLVTLVNRLAERGESHGRGRGPDRASNPRSEVDDIAPALPCEPEYEPVPDHLG